MKRISPVMSEEVEQTGDSDQELRLLAVQERKLKGKWESFKKVLRGNKTLDPDCASRKFDQEQAKYEEAMKLIEQEREQIIAT
jgi:hypothetical protein